MDIYLTMVVGLAQWIRLNWFEPINFKAMINERSWVQVRQSPSWLGYMLYSSTIHH